MMQMVNAAIQQAIEIGKERLREFLGALLKHTGLSAAEVVRESLAIAAGIDIYTNSNLTVEELPCQTTEHRTRVDAPPDRRRARPRYRGPGRQPSGPSPSRCATDGGAGSSPTSCASR